jgi:hypothetical protein
VCESRQFSASWWSAEPIPCVSAMCRYLCRSLAWLTVELLGGRCCCVLSLGLWQTVISGSVSRSSSECTMMYAAGGGGVSCCPDLAGLVLACKPTVVRWINTLAVAANIYKQRPTKVDDHHVKSRQLACTVVARRPCEAVRGLWPWSERCNSATGPAPYVHNGRTCLRRRSRVSQERNVNGMHAMPLSLPMSDQLTIPLTRHPRHIVAELTPVTTSSHHAATKSRPGRRSLAARLELHLPSLDR